MNASRSGWLEVRRTFVFSAAGFKRRNPRRRCSTRRVSSTIWNQPIRKCSEFTRQVSRLDLSKSSTITINRRAGATRLSRDSAPRRRRTAAQWSFADKVRSWRQIVTSSIGPSRFAIFSGLLKCCLQLGLHRSHTNPTRQRGECPLPIPSLPRGVNMACVQHQRKPL
jgi:hypothetical protein